MLTLILANLEAELLRVEGLRAVLVDDEDGRVRQRREAVRHVRAREAAHGLCVVRTREVARHAEAAERVAVDERPRRAHAAASSVLAVPAQAPARRVVRRLASPRIRIARMVMPARGPGKRGVDPAGAVL
jgi:hypothetical protein